MLITLTGEEISIATRLGRDEHDQVGKNGSSLHNIRSTPIGQSMANHVLGKLGEMAVCKFYRLSLEEQEGGLRMPDVVVNGKPIDVKTYRDRRFLNVIGNSFPDWTGKKIRDGWFFAFVHQIDQSTYDLIGGIPARKLLTEEYWMQHHDPARPDRYPNHTPCWRAKEEELTRFRTREKPLRTPHELATDEALGESLDQSGMKL